MFVDRVTVHVRGGRGGDGVTAFQRQPFQPKGPPDGGDGGDGGSVVLEADPQLATLVDLHWRPHRKAGRGAHGSGDLRRGRNGADEVIRVPLGTTVRDADGEPLADLVVPRQRVVVAGGGRGGRGNAAFRTRRRRAPRFHESGAPGEERSIVLELRLIADVALVGFPNAGKSSLIAQLSAARPKIADYPFTTLTPNLGVVTTDDLDFVVADVPGLIEGAAEGRGLGHDFLRHVERAGALVHVVDLASFGRDPLSDVKAITAELDRYRSDLLDRPALVFLNKVDAEPEMADLVRPELEEQGWEVLAGSAVTGAGVDELRWRLADLVRHARAERDTDSLDVGDVIRPVLRPRPVDSGPDFTVRRHDGGGWVVAGARIERWVLQLDLDNPEAVAYLQGRLERAGVERALEEAGAEPGDDVEIAGAVFTFQPDAPPHDDSEEE